MGVRVMNGDEVKFRELILYIAEKSADDYKLGRTKLNKILYYADHICYLQFGKAITGVDYMHIEQGPVPRQMKPVLSDMLDKGLIDEICVRTGNYVLHKPVAKRRPDLSMFAPREISVIDAVIQQFWLLNGTDVSNMSHAEVGWLVTTDRESIPYETFRFPPYMEYGETDRCRTRELIDEFGWQSKYAA